MQKELSFMILNGVNLGISKIELNKSDLIIVDKSGKYCLKICVQYNWKDINNIKIGQKQEVDFNEYCLAENNESALIWPSSCCVEKISDDSICFSLKFKDISNSIHYMNKRNCFDIKLNSLEVNVFIDYKDAINDYIIYNL